MKIVAPILALLLSGQVDQGQAVISLDTWVRLQDQLRDLKTEAAPPIPYLIVDRRISAGFDRGVFSGELEVRIEVLAPDRGLLVPLIDATASLSEVEVDGQRAVAIASGQFYSVLIEGPGQHRARVRFAHGRQEARFTRAFTMALPLSPVTALNLELPEKNLDVQIEGGVILGQKSVEPGTKIDAALDGNKSLSVRWQRRLTHRGSETREMEAETLALASIGEEAIETKTEVSFRLLSGETDRLEVGLEEGTEVIAVKGAAILQWYTEVDGTKRKLIVLLRHLVEDQVSIMVDAQAPRSSGANTKVPFLVPLDAKLRGGFVAVEGRDGFDVKVASIDDGEDVGTRELPERLSGLSEKPLLFAWRHGERLPSLELSIARNAELALTQSIVDDLQASTVLVEQGVEITKMRLYVRNNTRQYLGMELPEGAQLTHALIDGTPFHPAFEKQADGRERLLIPLRQSEKLSDSKPRMHVVRSGETLGEISLMYLGRAERWNDILAANEEVGGPDGIVEGQRLKIPARAGEVTLEESNFILELAYKVKVSPLALFSSHASALPKLDIQVMSATWHYYFPAAYEPLRFDTNLQQLTSIRYDPLRRILRFWDDATRIAGAWAGDFGYRKDSYENILSTRKSIYRREQTKKVAEALSAFPLVGERYRFSRVLLGDDQAFVRVLYLDKAVVPWLQWGALLLAAFLAYRATRHALRHGLKPALRAEPTLTFLSAAALLMMLGHYVLGVNRNVLLGVDLALLAALIPAFFKARSSPKTEKTEKPKILRVANLLKLAAASIAAAVVLTYPLFLSSFVLIAALIAAFILRRKTAALLLFLLPIHPADAQEKPETVTIPLEQLERARRELAELTAQRESAEPVAQVAVGETIYRGASDGRNLRLTLTLRAQLARGKQFKDVPVIGTDAVVVSAKLKGQPIALAIEGGYWVWKTRESGPVELAVELIVPPRGPRGSIEYGFRVVESPVTELIGFFPTPDLEPAVTGAVKNEVNEVRGGTELRAVLTPTRELHILGFHDVRSGDSDRRAKLYGETHNLISLADGSIELFSVISLAILYAPEKRFRIELPQGYDLVSADGKGAFQYTVETNNEKTILIGETAFGIEHRYEISLRLKRALTAAESKVSLPVPKLLDVERDAGFVALEVPGKMSIAGVEGKGLLGIDVRELPSAILESSVTPIVRAFRYSGERGEASIAIARHPEKSLAPGGVDVLRATSVLTADGRVMTDLTFTLRNNLQQYLALELAPGEEVRSAVLDGDPIKPSRDEKGRVLVPLKRSKHDGGTLKPFRVQLVYESGVDRLGWFGRRELILPKVEAPIASLNWSVLVPGRMWSTELDTDVAAEVFVKNASWHRGHGVEVEEEGDGELEDGYEANNEAGWDADEVEQEESEPAPAEAPDDRARFDANRERAAGAMPVRVQIPRDGRELSMHRYWIDAQEPVRARFTYARTPLPMAAQLAGVLFAGAAIAFALIRRSRRRVLELGGALLLALALGASASPKAGMIAALGGLAAALIARGEAVRLATALVEKTKRAIAAAKDSIARTVREATAAFEERRKTGWVVALAHPLLAIAWFSAKLVALSILGVVLFYQLWQLFAVLNNPL